MCAITETLLYLYRVVGRQSHGGEADPTLVLYSGEALLLLSGYLNSQKNR